MSGCAGAPNSESVDSSHSSPSSIAQQPDDTAPSVSASQPQASVVHRLSEFIEFDPDKVVELEHAHIYHEPSTVESVTLFKKGQAKDMAQQLADMVVSAEGNIGDYTTAGGVTVRYTLTFAENPQPMIIYYAGTYHLDSLDSPPVCYVDSNYYKDIFTSPDFPDIILPQDSETIMYDIVGNKRVARTQ